MRLGRIVGILSACCMLFGGAQTAGAAEAEDGSRDLVESVMLSADPHAEFEDLSDSGKAKFIESMKPVKVETTGEVPLNVSARSADGCWNQTAEQSYKSNFGFTAYRMYVSSHWCASGGRVTEHQITGASGEALAPGYTYQGIAAQGAVNYGDRGVSAAQGHFKVWETPDWVPLPGVNQYACIKQITRPGASSSVTGHLGGACNA